VIQDDLLVKVFEFGVHKKRSPGLSA